MDLHKNLQSELDKVRVDQAEKENTLRSRIESLNKKTTSGDEWKSRYDNLQQDHEELKRALHIQQKVTDEVRKEASSFLNEMKSISEQSHQKSEQQEKQMVHIQNLDNEIMEWKRRHAQTKAQLRTMRTGSTGLSMDLPNASRLTKNRDFTRPEGLIKDVHVTRFQIAIDEVLQFARGDEPLNVLGGMKMVVIAIRHLLRDINGQTSKISSTPDQLQQQIKLRTKVSATANNFITASKNFALSGGISPVSLLDAAASHLTSAVVEAVRTVKMRLTSSDESDDDDDESLSTASPGYFGAPNGAPSIAESLYSPYDSLKAPVQMSNEEQKSLGPAQTPPTLNNVFDKSIIPSGLNIGFGTKAADPAIDELKVRLQS